MRATVGPLPPAVYWRRRVVVLGALLLAVIVFFVSCSGSDDDNKRGATGKGASQAPTPAPGGSKPEEEPSFSDGGGGDPSLPAPDDLESNAPNPDPGANPSTGNPTGANANVTAPANGDCTDQELTLTPLPAVTSVKRGASLVIRLKIKNLSTRTCTRDLGAGAQELYIVQGARKFWSSDTCSTDRSAEVTRMSPGSEYEFTVTWNGQGTTKCEASMPAGPALPAGNYEVRGRLNAKVSEPAALAIVA